MVSTLCGCEISPYNCPLRRVSNTLSTSYCLECLSDHCHCHSCSLLFRAKELTEQVCACGGGVPRDDQPEFQHIGESAKLGTRAHGKHKTNLLGAMMKYGTDKHRLDKMTRADLEAAEMVLDPELMATFNYFYPPIPSG